MRNLNEHINRMKNLMNLREYSEVDPYAGKHYDASSDEWIDTDVKGADDVPSVIAECACIDCIFNKNKYCIADKISLSFSKDDKGNTICECDTYQVE